MGWLSIWWVWLALGVALAILEVIAPAFIFLGFAIAAVAISLLMLIPLTLSGAALLALFGALSLASWIVLKLMFRKQSSGARIVTKDVND